MRINLVNNYSEYDYSDYFEIFNAIKVTNPSSTTTWMQKDQDVNISWDAGNLGGTVLIELYRGSSKVNTIGTAINEAV